MGMEVYVARSHYMTIIPHDEEIFNKKGKLNGINTWRDWHLLPTSRPVFNPPSVKTNYVSIPGADGAIDATEVLTPYPVYNNREGTVEFIVITGYGNWANRYSDIMDYLHGRKFKVILETDPGYYYEGRLAVNEWRSEKDHSKIVFDYNLDPYKYELTTSTEDWLWDPFNFYDGIIHHARLFTKIPIEMGDIGEAWEWDPFNFYYGVIGSIEDNVAQLKLPIHVRSMPTVPTFKINRDHRENHDDAEDAFLRVIKYKSDGETVDVVHEVTPTDYQPHTYKFPDIILRGTNNYIGLACGPKSKFRVTIDFRCGRL